jgi:hypothetical protein
MKRTILLLAAAAACSSQGPRSELPDSLGLARAASSITAADVHDHVAFLASDRLRGRDTPSPGLDTAAQWIADEMASIGLEPAGDEGWFQRYPFPSEGIDPHRTTLRAAAGATHAFEYGIDFLAWVGRPVPGVVGVVYAGSALDAGAPDVRGRAVLLRLEGLPEVGPLGFQLGPTMRDAVHRAVEAGLRAEAAALVFVLDRRVTPGEIGALAESAEATRRTLGGIDREALPPPAFFITRPVADRLAAMAEVDPGTLLNGSEPRQPVPLPGLTLGMDAPTRVTDDARPPNVAGVIRGRDPELRETYVVVSAHMDHVGVGEPDASGDSIYNGADDDASGTAVLLEIADAMARMDPPRRSVLFLAVSGEEKGLLGSRWFVEHPTVPLDSIVANLNLDMVARNAPDTIVVIGQEYSSLGTALHAVAEGRRQELGLTVADDPWPEQRFFFRSDHFSFVREEIPALFFFAGTHEDYHRPGDEVDDIDADKAARVGRLVFYLTRTLADSEQTPTWDPEGLETVRRLTER